MEKLDYKKSFPDLYLPKSEPMEIFVPEMKFIMVDGKGDPNKEGGAYQKALEILYGLSYTIKMSKMGRLAPEGYFEYVVPPLEGLWSIRGETGCKENLQWTSMIRQPEFVSQEVFSWACGQVTEKKGLDCSGARLEQWQEGRCIQCMHVGPYDDEPATIRKLHQFAQDRGWRLDYSDRRRHHELYLSDPRRVRPERMKTVLRLPIEEE